MSKFVKFVKENFAIYEKKNFMKEKKSSKNEKSWKFPVFEKHFPLCESWRGCEKFWEGNGDFHERNCLWNEGWFEFIVNNNKKKIVWMEGNFGGKKLCFKILLS